MYTNTIFISDYSFFYCNNSRPEDYDKDNIKKWKSIMHCERVKQKF